MPETSPLVTLKPRPLALGAVRLPCARCRHVADHPSLPSYYLTCAAPVGCSRDAQGNLRSLAMIARIATRQNVYGPYAHGAREASCHAFQDRSS